MPRVFERTPETEEAMSYSYPDLVKEVLGKVSQRREETSQRLLEGRPTNEDLLEIMFAGVGGVIKKFPFATAGALAKRKGLERVRRGIPSSLRKFLIDEESAERLSNLIRMKRFKLNIAPATALTEEFYRPAVRVGEGKILWHPKAKMHSDAIILNLKGKNSFDYSSVKGSGGIGPDGHYYEQFIESDALLELWYTGVKDTSKSWRP